jgi:dihydrofolate synthase/folylpolyglutamate synthase
VQLLRQQKIAVSDAALAEGLRTVRWPARLEILQRSPWIVLDCAHNPASVAAARAWFVDQVPARRRQLLLGLSKDKDLPGIIGQLVGYFDHVYLTRYANSQRAADPAKLAHLWQQSGGGPSSVFESTGEALNAARASLHPDDALLVTGSVFLAGEARQLLAKP